jgi:hypothetical protein
MAATSPAQRELANIAKAEPMYRTIITQAGIKKLQVGTSGSMHDLRGSGGVPPHYGVGSNHP